MSGENTKTGLFSSLHLGRASKQPKQTQTAESLTHPLLGASSSSLNLADPQAAADLGSSLQATGTTSRQASVTNARDGTLPYKPRQRGHHAQSGSTSSINSAGAQTITTQQGQANVSTSPTTPSSISGRPTTSTSVASTFALAASTNEAGPSVDVEQNGSASHNASATSRLQQQSLKAATQLMGLANGSLGMAIVDTMFEKSLMGKGKAADDGEWMDLMKVVMTGQVHLLLPTTSASASPVTPAIIRDHCIYIAPGLPFPSDAANRPFIYVGVTCAGLLGTISESTISLESFLPPNPQTSLSLGREGRNSRLASLRPAYLSYPSTLAQLPTYAISSEPTMLRFPGPSKEDNSPMDSGNLLATKLGRINPFGSLFGGSPNQGASPAKGGTMISTGSPSKRSSNQDSSKSHLGVSPDEQAGSSRTSPQLSTMSLDNEANSTSLFGSPDGFEISAYTISKQLRQGDLTKSLAKIVKSHVKDELKRLPEKVVNRVTQIILSGLSLSVETAGKKELDVLSFSDLSHPEDVSQRLQKLIEEVYDELVLHYQVDSSHIFSESSDTGSRLRQKASWSSKSSLKAAASLADESEEAKKARLKRARREKERMVEREATAGTEKVEAVICRLLYNRLFSPIDSDDARHDDVLSSRVAALNMLELSLDHLGLQTQPEDASQTEKETIQRGLADIVEKTGHELQKLSCADCLAPGDKIGALIQAHKIVVDSLAKLPPIGLRPEGEPYRPPSRAISPTSELPPQLEAAQTALAAAPEPLVTPAGISGPRPIMTRSRSSTSRNSTPLSASPAASDPLTSISGLAHEIDLAEAPPGAVQVPQVTLTESQPATSLSSKDHPNPKGEVDDSRNPEEDENVTLAQSAATTSGADLILPIMIYAVVKANPSQLASHLLYLRRYRSAICLTGEASYAMVNLTAVIEFIEHVQFTELGLGDDADKVISVEALSPIGLDLLGETNPEAVAVASASSRLRGRVFQVGELAGTAADSANKVITGVVDSSWSALRGLIAASPAQAAASEITVPSPASDANRPRHGSTSAFSLSNVTASVATMAAAATNRSRSRANTQASENNAGKLEKTWKGNEELKEVTSRPGSIAEASGYEVESDHEKGENTDTAWTPPTHFKGRRPSDVRSIVSVSSVMSKGREVEKDTEVPVRKDIDRDRLSISDRLSSIGMNSKTSTSDNQPTGLGITSPPRSGFGSASVPPQGRKISLLGLHDGRSSPAESINSTSGIVPPLSQLEGPIDKFMTCEVGDIRLSEVGTLLRDYRRIGGIINNLKANDEH